MSKNNKKDVIEEKPQIKGGLFSGPVLVMLLIALVMFLIYMLFSLIHFGFYLFNDSYFCSQQELNTTYVWERCKHIIGE